MRFFTLSILLLLQSSILFANAEIIFEESGKQGLKDERGEILIPARFEELGWSSGGKAVVSHRIGYRQNGKWGLISTGNRIITKAEFNELQPAGEQYFIAKRTDVSLRFVPSGIIGENGETVVPFAYLNIKSAGDKFIIQKLHEYGVRSGMITDRNQFILQAIFKDIRYLGADRIAVMNDSRKWAIFSMKGRPLTSFAFDDIDEYADGTVTVYRSGAAGLLGSDGSWVIPAEYAKIQVNRGQANVWAFPEWDILTEGNQKLHSVAFDSVLPWQHEYWKVIANGHEWIVDRDFNAITPSTYDHIDWLNEQLMIFAEDDKYGIIKPSGEKVIQARYDTLFAVNARIYAFQDAGVNRGWSLFDLQGTKITSFSYQDMRPEQESGLIPVRRNLKWGMLHRDGKEVIPCTYDAIGSSLPGLIAVGFQGKSGIIDESDNWILPPRDGKIYLIDKNFYLLKDKDVTYLKHMTRGTVYFSKNPIQVKNGYLIETRSNDSFWKINFSGQILNDAQHKEYEEIRLESEGYIAIKMNGRYGFIDRQDRLRIANRYDDVTDFHEGLAGFKLLNQWGFLDKQERIVVQPRFDTVTPFQNYLCNVSEKNMKGVIDRKGNWIIKPEYEHVERLENGRYKITKGGKTGLLSEDGRIIVNPKYDNLRDLEGGQVIVNRHGKYGLVSRRGDDLIPITYDILLFDPYNQCYLGMKKVGSKTVPLR